MKHQVLTTIVLLATFGSFPRAQAGETPIQFSGSGISGSAFLTFGSDTVPGDPSGAFAITGISGTFSDSNIGLTDVAITGLVPINPVNPPYGAPFPASLSFYSVTNPPPGDSAISYDNLFYPDGSPNTCPGYPGAGGYFDIYGVLFTLANGDIVDLWSNGTFPGGPPLDYGAGVINGSDAVVDFQPGGLSLATPEPGSLCLLITGLVGAAAWRRRSATAHAK